MPLKSSEERTRGAGRDRGADEGRTDPAAGQTTQCWSEPSRYLGGYRAYKGLFVVDIDANRDIIEMSNGDVVVAGQLADRDVTEESKRRIQIREVIRAHLDKERELFAQGVKVLSLLFIDEVAKYRDYGRDDTMGDYARVFEEEYQAAVEESLGELVLDSAAERYRAYLQRDEVRDVHEATSPWTRRRSDWSTRRSPGVVMTKDIRPTRRPTT